MILDSQSVKGAETVGKDSRGFDGHKMTNGRKRHLAVDMRGIPLTVMVTGASPHDSVPARDLLFRLRLTHPEVTVVWADSAYGGPLVDWARSFLGLTLKTVPRRKDQDGFAVLAKRWRVERAISWVMRARRNVRDYERLISHSEAHITWTTITLMTRRLTCPPPTATRHAAPPRAGENSHQTHADPPPDTAPDDSADPCCLALTWGYAPTGPVGGIAPTAPSKRQKPI